MTLHQDIPALQSRMSAAVRQHWKAFLFEGILLVVLGLGAMILPPLASLAVTIFLGWMFLISGVAGLAMTFWARQMPGFWWSLFSAAWHAAGDVAIVATGSAAATDQVAKAADLGDPVDAYKQAGLPEPAHAAADTGTGAAPTGTAPTAATGAAPTGAAPAPTGAGLPAGVHPKPGDPGVLRHVEAGGALILIPIALRVLSRLRNK